MNVLFAIVRKLELLDIFSRVVIVRAYGANWKLSPLMCRALLLLPSLFFYLTWLANWKPVHTGCIDKDKVVLVSLSSGIPIQVEEKHYGGKEEGDEEEGYA